VYLNDSYLTRRILDQLLFGKALFLNYKKKDT
jgi:hypothetical protein